MRESARVESEIEPGGVWDEKKMHFRGEEHVFLQEGSLLVVSSGGNNRSK